ncbi:hypothetical protein DTO169C6_8992 [Paecilomyces variotii]|nr:hypothetical protein DTO169C6_8992 [Paecilomyces variotii]
MLTAFTARPLVELKPRDKSKIESVLANGDRLLVGLNNGVLRIYRVNELVEENAQQQDEEGNGHAIENGVHKNGSNGHDRPGSASPTQQAAAAKVRSTDLLREVEKFARYKIEQLGLIKEADLLISLSGGYVSIHDLQTYQLHEQLTRTKGASTFAVTRNIIEDPETGVPSIVSRLAVAVKRKILLWTWRNSELDSDTAEITLVSGVKTITWASATKLIAGLSSNYVMVDIESMEITDLVGPGSIGGGPGQETSRLGGVGVVSMSYIGMGGMVPKPLATRLREGQVLLAKDVNTHFIDIDGNSLGRKQIPWNHAPESIGYSYPYVLALQEPSKGTVEVRNPETLSLLQSISLPSANLMYIPAPDTSLAHAGKGFLVASDRVIWRMEALSYDSQIDSLVENGQFDEAISLISMLEDALLKDKANRLREVKLQKAQELFNARKYRDSLDLFAEVSAPPEIVIRLYPRIIAGDMSSVVEESDESEASPIEPQQKTNGNQAHTETVGAEDTGGAKNAAYAPSVRSFLRSRGDDGPGSEAGSIRGKPLDTGVDKRLEGKDLKAAVRELQGFLADIRRRFQRFINPDGSLKVSQVEISESNDEFTESVRKLLGIPKDDGDHEFADRLREAAKLVDTTLFRAHMYATPSLAGSLFRIANFCDPDVVMEKLEESERYNELIDFLYGKKMHRPALELLRKFGQAETEEENAPQLHGPRRTVAYLQNLPPDMIDLILEFAEWPLRADPDLGMEIFLADTENAETLPRQRVLEFLEKVDSDLAVRYLEHVIGELNDETPELHQRLLTLYLERLQKHKSGERKFAEEKEYDETKNKFLDLLKSSAQYSPAKMLDRLPRDDPEFFEARAILFSKMGQHKQALEIYVFKIGDHAKAEEYCNHIHMSEDNQPPEGAPSGRIAPTDEGSDKQSIYLTLLSLYLSPPHAYKPQYGPALEILAKHGSRLPANSTLNLIPETLPVRDLEFYFRGRMRAANTIMNEARIVAGLQKVQNISTQAQLLLGEGGRDPRATRSRHVTVTEERVCVVCHKRLGGSVINVFPDNTVVHLGCASRINTTA